MINVDFLLAGCNTRCKHCYVNGGPGPMMPVGDALACIERLDALAAHLPGDVSFTLDHEPVNHPCLGQILRMAAQTRHIENYHHGMTTGVGLMARPDKAAVVQAYLECGYETFGVTLHGGPAHHNEIVRRRNAYEAAIAAGKFLKAHGAKLDVSLMLNRFFPADADMLTAAMEDLQPDYIYFAIPIFTPHRNMLDFEPYRASMETLRQLRGYLLEWRQDEAAILKKAEQSTISAAIEHLRCGPGLRERFSQAQDELYLTLHPDCKLYVGNSGAESRCLGDLRSIDLKAAAEQIRSLPGNRDYGAYYDAGRLPEDGALIETLEKLPPGQIYGDLPSAIYRGLAEMGVPTNILC